MKTRSCLQSAHQAMDYDVALDPIATLQPLSSTRRTRYQRQRTNRRGPRSVNVTAAGPSGFHRKAPGSSLYVTVRGGDSLRATESCSAHPSCSLRICFPIFACESKKPRDKDLESGLSAQELPCTVRSLNVPVHSQAAHLLAR
jgi:hypothetical protein